MERIQPSAILIEGPSDFNPQFDEVHHGHELPIAIYSYVRFGDGSRSGVFYPFCEYSPEWQAVVLARERGIAAEFIDLPWADLATDRAAPVHRYADGEERRSNYLLALTHRFGLEDYDDLWDQLFEIDPALPLDRYLIEFHRLLYFARQTNPGSAEDRRREAFMAERIRAALDRYGAPVVVVTGGFHSYPLYQRLQGLPLDEPDDRVPAAEPGDRAQEEITERGIALTPYSYERLDSLTGYDAGLPNPGFYHRAWTAHATGQVHRSLLASVASALRHKKQAISTADLIASEVLINGLATLRGHARPWRRDLVDGVRGALVKDDLGPGGWHPVLEAVHEALRGDRRGKLAEGTRLPPLVHDIRRHSEIHGLLPEKEPRTVTLDLTRQTDLVRARLLHRLAELGIAGYVLRSGGDVARRDDLTQVMETWGIAQDVTYESSCIEAAIYGPALAEASRAKLEDRAANGERSSGAASRMLLSAALMGHFDLADCFEDRLGELIREEGDFAAVSEAVNTLLYLYRYDDVLGAARQAAFARLLAEAYHRGLWIAEGLAQVSLLNPGAPQGIRLLRETVERCGPDLGLAREEFVEVFTRIAANALSPMLRGAATGVLWSMAVIDSSRITLPMTANPEDLGDFLTGLFQLAKEAIQRHPELARDIDRLVAGLDDEQFLVALPPLRLAFTVFTPREKDHIGAALFGRERPAELAVPIVVAAEVLAWEGRLFAAMERFGVVS